MKIENGSAAKGVSSTYRSASPAAAGFEVEASAVKTAAPAGPAAGLTAVHSLDALLALQATPTLAERRKRAVKRAGRLLDVLDAMKLDLLDGAATPSATAELQKAVIEERSEVEDPRLASVLDEIEVRAAVELAKREASQGLGNQAI
jgi:hypothetical protein